MTPVSASGRQTHSQQGCDEDHPSASLNGRTINTIIVGSGPTALMVARILSGREFFHGQKECGDMQHLACQEFEGRVYWDEFPESLSTSRGKTPAGNWFDSFRFLNGTDEQVHCLKWRDDPDKAVDWHLFSELPPGGSWQTYRSDQMTISPYTYMEFPDYPLDTWFAKGNPHEWDDTRPGRKKIINSQLCPYFETYASSLDQSRMHTGYRVIDAWKEGGLWNVKVSLQNQSGSEQILKCRNLVCAVGSTHINRKGVPGEDAAHVSHTTREAFEKIKPGQKILVLGSGLSAADVIIHAWKQQCHVTHIVDGKTIEDGKKHISKNSPLSSSKVLFALKELKECPEHQGLVNVIEEPAGHENKYTQLKDWQLQAMSEGKCELLTPEKKNETFRFHHVAILIGSRPDLSWLKTKFTDKQLLGLEVINCSTHEGYEDSIRGLFMVGGCVGEPFQRFVFGQAIAAGETIKAQKPLTRNSSTPDVGDSSQD
ncbi:NAD(P)-binding domain-containing protein [Sansalvadorimonas sp. 2012CJ34-2]|uniref:NAD(P)-binding domain-containing protein n=1 Tax=Parendozoicomonas callyspongiae TaxID=2942213 RepID=A0ABT0PBW5_9GAMM|nr:NAD(P)-binding domain-containing protein [Sansalvadorimonas sp. 2012CJ34-2]MCL6268810.1 NAD(P)-binding domain-containing protein [Sansalvadorimonas sp. 2012CJ34-2]